MSKTTVAEFRKMTVADLRKEEMQQRTELAKLRLAVHMQKEKNAAKYTAAKKQLARLLTVVTEKAAEELQKKSSDTTLSTPSAK